MENKLSDLIYRFDQGKLYIDINSHRNPMIMQYCSELAGILDVYSSVAPFNGEAWCEYIPKKIDRWEYIMCDNGRGTACDHNPKNADVITVKDFLFGASGCMVTDEDFESVF